VTSRRREVAVALIGPVVWSGASAFWFWLLYDVSAIIAAAAVTAWGLLNGVLTVQYVLRPKWKSEAVRAEARGDSPWAEPVPYVCWYYITRDGSGTVSIIHNEDCRIDHGMPNRFLIADESFRRRKEFKLLQAAGFRVCAYEDLPIGCEDVLEQIEDLVVGPVVLAYNGPPMPIEWITNAERQAIGEEWIDGLHVSAVGPIASDAPARPTEIDEDTD
jgi:hypothetical protein